ncbi:hypothetical protein HID58_068011 [Brassica napus]|uniref:Pentatricopeptide repeat-containing protein n=1 Tax=Brassica napus TaxID=3708 RepID=A0ABQ7ZK65_BRANA|nr:hypothetical protein HID58_068011 [Brassica napus]
MMNVEIALMIFEYMRKRDMDVSIVYYHYSNRCARLKMLWFYFGSLSSKIIKPNVVTYTTMISGFSIRGLIHEADALFRKMKKDGFFTK